MTVGDIPNDLVFLDHRLRALGRGHPNPAFQAQLRTRLMGRHEELARKRHSLPKRLTLAVSPILAVAAALLLFLSGLDFSGQRPAPSAEAARITAALARTVPTVTGVRLTYYRHRAGVSEQYQCLPQHGQHLYIRGGRTFIFSRGRWYRLNRLSSSGRCPQDWQLAFASLPARLAAHQFTVLPARSIGGIDTVGIQYTMAPRLGARIIVTAWVDRTTGLIMRLERTRLVGNTVVAQDIADYQYQRTP